jgi:uncharacterized membrane-anchored protein
MFRALDRLCVVLAMIIALAMPATAADDAAFKTAWEAAQKVARLGPADIPFGDQAVLKLPTGMAYIPVAEATTLTRLMGNNVGPGFAGFVVPTTTGNWIVFFDQAKDGYVSDADVKNWNTDDLLQSLKDATAAQNNERIKAGIPALDVVGWVEVPHYDAGNHRLIWSVKAVRRGAPAGSDATINYNTYALGRDGYYEINLVTGSSTVEQEKPYVQQLLASFQYNSGKRYEDFNAGTDHVAEYGIAALIAGVAAKKLGLLALAGVFFAKFFKIILVGLAVAGGGLMRFFRRGKSPTA